MERYEVFTGRTERNRKKSYLVFNFDSDKGMAIKAAKSFFKCSEDHLSLFVGWRFRNNLYFEDPGIKGAKKVAFIEYTAGGRNNGKCL